MKLASDKPGVVGNLDNLHQLAVNGTAGDAQTCRFESLQVLIVELKAVAVTFDNNFLAIKLSGYAALPKLALLAAEAHGTTKVRELIPGFELPFGIEPLGNQAITG